MLTKLKKYKLNQQMIAKMLGYSSYRAFYNSSAKKRILKGIEKILEHVDEMNKGY